MAKEKRGLPQGFGLNVVKPTTDQPTQWGDYVEEEIEGGKRSGAPESKVVRMPSQPERTPEQPPARVEATATGLEEEAGAEEEALSSPPPARASRRREPVAKPAKQFQRPLRVQLNMTAGTLRMLEDLIQDARTYSAEKNTSMADVYEALILAAFEAREEIDFARIRPRGRWGTPTAAAFRVALKTAFQRGIATHVQKEG